MIVTTTFIFRCFIIVLTNLLFTFSLCAFSQVSKESKALYNSDSIQIVSVVDIWQVAWNNHDMHLLGNLFHEDGIWILWNGKVWKGKYTIEAELA